MQENILDLISLQQILKSGIEGIFLEKVWLKAEISALNTNSNGHCYLELSQSDNSGIIAKVRAVIWRTKYAAIKETFEQQTNTSLKPGMFVLFQIRVNYSELYGLTLFVEDVEAKFTLGEKEAQRQASIKRLVENKLVDRQKQLKLSFLPYRLAVISSKTAAGYGDFQRHILENEYGFAYELNLFEALMQGPTAPKTIIQAMEAIVSAEEKYDAVLILRGGGSDLDLACFDDYDLAEAIALCPIPVFTAIGHDRDYHIADMVAYKHLKTPTAMADEFISCYIAEDEMIASYSYRVKIALLNKISSLESCIKLLQSKIKNVFANKIMQLLSKIDILENRIKTADPKLLISRGYTMAVDSRGVILNSIKNKKVGDDLRLFFRDGNLDCKVTAVNDKKQ